MYRNLVEEYYRLVDDQKFDEFGTIFHPNIVYDRPGYKQIVGLESLVKFYKKTRILKDGVHEISKIIIDDDTGASCGIYIGKTKKGKDVKVQFADFYTFLDNKIYTRITYFYKKSV